MHDYRELLFSHIHMCEPACGEPFLFFANIVRIYANTRPLRPLDQSHTTSDEISACEYGANNARIVWRVGGEPPRLPLHVHQASTEHMPESFTALFTARDGGVPVGSAAGCGPLLTCYRSHKLLGRSRGRGRDLERRQFSPVKTEVISRAGGRRSQGGGGI